jgi:hypothetical protein
VVVLDSAVAYVMAKVSDPTQVVSRYRAGRNADLSVGYWSRLTSALLEPRQCVKVEVWSTT